MRDLISLAEAGAQPGELGRIYEWYNARTARAIATSYAVGVAAAGAVLKYVADKEHETFAPGFLLVVIVVAAVAGVFQHAELAQLPRELAEATRLLASFRWLIEAGVDLGRPLPQDDGKVGFGWLWWPAALVPCGLAVVGALETDCYDLDLAVAAAAWVVIVVLVRRICAELPARVAPPRGDSLVDQIGEYQLDQYVTNRAIAKKVNTYIDEATAVRRRPIARD